MEYSRLYFSAIVSPLTEFPGANNSKLAKIVAKNATPIKVKSIFLVVHSW